MKHARADYYYRIPQGTKLAPYGASDLSLFKVILSNLNLLRLSEQICFYTKQHVFVEQL